MEPGVKGQGASPGLCCVKGAPLDPGRAGTMGERTRGGLRGALDGVKGACPLYWHSLPYAAHPRASEGQAGGLAQPNTRLSARGYDCRAAAQGRWGGPGAPAARSPPARLGAQHRAGGAATPASARPGDRVGAGWAEGKKGPTTLQGAFFGRAPTAQKINGRVGGTAQGGRSPRALRGLALRRAAGEQPTFAPQGLRSIYARPWAACAPHRRPKGGRLRRRPRPPEQGAQRPKWWAGLPLGPQGPTPGGHARAGREGGPGGKGLPRSGKGPPVLR